MARAIVAGLSALVGALLVQWWFGRKQWVVRINNRTGTETPPMSYFHARALRRQWPRNIARVVRVADGW